MSNYLYVLDAELAERKFRTLVSRIEARTMELGIAGRMERLSPLTSATEMVREAARRGSKTIVVVGTDATVGKVMPAVVAANATLGFIPTGPSRIAHILGIPDGVAACDVVAKRVVARVDLGKANQTYFLFSLDAPAEGLIIETDNMAVSARTSDARISICNIGPLSQALHGTNSKPTDGFLEAVVSRPSRQFSRFFRTEFEADTVLPVTHLKVKCPTDCKPLVADDQTVVKTPVSVEIAPKKLAVIVGRDRSIAR